ncbi:hypothetical protein ATCR1_07704 [Agrobacterium tumefaciens CCNWGS0286]|nr:hypothetical protein ATCR1_07704 [Agrobacterium tumefaciens CCNWGS0286]
MHDHVVDSIAAATADADDGNPWLEERYAGR